MRKIIMVGMVVLPHMVFAATDCRVVEYPDHFEAVCVGDEKTGPVPAKATMAVEPAAKTQASEKALSTAKPQLSAAPATVQDQATGNAQASRQAQPDVTKGALAEKLMLRKLIRDAARASRQRLMAQHQ